MIKNIDRNNPFKRHSQQVLNFRSSAEMLLKPLCQDPDQTAPAPGVHTVFRYTYVNQLTTIFAGVLRVKLYVLCLY